MLDRRLPGVYVDIEDRSYAEPSIEAGRSGYVVILSDRGRHNQVVQLNDPQDLYDLYGKPDLFKYGYGHYLADKFLQYSSKLYVVRPAMMEPPHDGISMDDCMSISHAFLSENDPSLATTVGTDFVFTNGSNLVTTDTTSSFADVNVGDWIFPESGQPEEARQIVEKKVDDSGSSTVYELILDDNFGGSDDIGSAKVFKFFEMTTQSALRDFNFDSMDQDILWYFHAIGAGEYYNNIFIKGVRNVEFERIYTDDDGNPLYPYNFMDIGVYRYNNEDNTTTMLEGPWTVSLANRTPSQQIIRDIYSGRELYLPTVINENSKLIRCVEGGNTGTLMSVSPGIEYPYEPDVNKRLMVQSLFAEGNVFGVETVGISDAKIDGGFFLKNGSNGNLFAENGMLNLTDEYAALIAQAYAGTLESTDGSVELIVQSVYPWYIFDYILCGGYNAAIAYQAKTLVDKRNDCLLLSDTGSNFNSPDDDLRARREDVPWNTWNAMLYTQYREITDLHTGKKIWMTPVAHAIERHLLTDARYWISEPVAGIEKGAIEEPCTLAYMPKLTKLGDMIEVELNPIINEPDGRYILTQYTTWKRLSIMKRAHVVKFIQFCKKRIPTLLKDILQRKATQFWINQCEQRVNGFMEQFIDRGDNSKFASISSYSTDIIFDEVRSEIRVGLTVHPLRAIEKIFVHISVT